MNEEVKQHLSTIDSDTTYLIATTQKGSDTFEVSSYGTTNLEYLELVLRVAMSQVEDTLGDKNTALLAIINSCLANVDLTASTEESKILTDIAKSIKDNPHMQQYRKGQ